MSVLATDLIAWLEKLPAGARVGVPYDDTIVPTTDMNDLKIAASNGEKLSIGATAKDEERWIALGATPETQPGLWLRRSPSAS